MSVPSESPPIESLPIEGLEVSLPMGAPVVGSRLVTREFLTVLLAQASFGYAFSSFLLLPKYLKVELVASASQIGLVSAVSGVAAMVALLACGSAVDRWGRRWFLTAGGLLMAAASLAFGITSSGELAP